MLRDLGLTRLQLTVIAESLRQSAAAKKKTKRAAGALSI